MDDSGGAGTGTGGGTGTGRGAGTTAGQPSRRARIRRLAAGVGPDIALLRRSDEFRRLYAGQMWSYAGNSISFVAMPYQAYQLTHSSLVVGLLSFAELVPLVATALLGGALADAVDRRRLIRGSQLFLCGGGAVLALNAVAWHQLWLLFLLAVLYAAPAAGGLIISMASGWTRHVSRHGRAIVLAVCGWGAGIAAFGFAPGLWWAVAALAAAGAADMISGIFRMTMWNQTIPASLRGRLAGLEMISYTTGEPVGNLEAGLVASATGSVRIAVVSGGVISVLGAAVVTAALPMLWRFDARDHPGGAGPVPGVDPVPGQDPAVSPGPAVP